MSARMMRSAAWPLVLVLLAPAARGDDPAPVQLTAEQDHKRLMDLLKIDSLRQGANGNDPKAANAANYDESKANPYPNLPDPLVLKDGTKVTTAEMWWKQRRPEIVEDFDREVYGRVPKETPKVRWEITDTKKRKVGDVDVVTKQLVGHVDNSAYPQITVDIKLTLTTPADAKGPVPVMMEFGFAGFGPPGFGESNPGSWQQQVLAKGWGYAILIPTTVQADNGGGLNARDHRPVQQGPAAQGGRLGRAAGVGVGRQPRPRLFRDRQGRGRQTGRHRGTFPLRQGGDRDRGVRRPFRRRLHRLLRRRGREAAPPQLRRAGGKRRLVGRVPLDGRELHQVRRAAEVGRLAGGLA